MSTPFQNRLVGTIIVAAAVIIFLPDILDGEKESYQADFEAIPQAPKFEGSKSHKSFPQEKLAAIPETKLSDEQAADDLLAANHNNAKPAASNVTSNAGSDAVKNNNTVVTPVTKPKTIIAEKPKQQLPAPVKKPVKKDEFAWVIHLGSFKHKKNVDELMSKLKGAGYTAFTQPIKTQKGTLTKVVVGPNLNKAELAQALPKLKKLTKVQGRIARFKVTK